MFFSVKEESLNNTEASTAAVTSTGFKILLTHGSIFGFFFFLLFEILKLFTAKRGN